MHTITSDVGLIHVVSTKDDALKLWDWLKERPNKILGLDAETNAVNDTFHQDYQLRLVQCSDGVESWVIRAQQPGMLNVIKTCVRAHPYWLAHFSENDIRFIECAAPGAIDKESIKPHVADLQPVLAWYDPRTVTSASKKERIDFRIKLPRGLKETVTRLLRTDVLDRAEWEMMLRFVELAAVNPDPEVIHTVRKRASLLQAHGVAADGTGLAVGAAFRELGVRSPQQTAKGNDCWNIKSLTQIASTKHSVAAELAEGLVAVRTLRSKSPYGTEKKLKTYGFATIPDDDETYWRYGGLDAMMTVRLWHLMKTELKRRSVWSSVMDSVTRQWHIDLMTLRGLLTDEDYVRRLNAHSEKIIETKAGWLARRKINPTGMGASIGTAFTALGVTSPKETGTGKASWDRTVLGALAKDDTNPAAQTLAKHINKVRQATKFHAAYIAPMITSLSSDHRLHASMREIGTGTSRNSAARPPLQQLPKRTDTTVRAAIQAPEGWVIVSADLSQGEPRVMAARSGDRNLLRDLEAGDFYSALATLAFGSEYNPEDGDEPDTPSFQMRNGSKIGFLLRCYGGGAEKLAVALDQTIDFAKETRAAWDREYHVLAEYERQLNWQPAVVLENGWVSPLWDRYYIDERTGLPVCGSKPSRLGLNYDTQGNQAVLLKNAHTKLIHQGWSWALGVLVHDEILGCVPLAKAEEFKQALTDAMTTTYRGVPIRCKAKINGRTWLPQPAQFNLEEIEELIDEELEDDE